MSKTADKKAPQNDAAIINTPAPADTLPEVQVLKTPAKGKTNKVICEPGKSYAMKIGDGDAAISVPFSLPKDVTKPVQVVLASANPNWLGRDGNELRVHICRSEHGTVMLQPHGVSGGWKANVFTGNRVTFAS